MPGSMGSPCSRRSRGSATTRDIPVVVVSARTLNAERLRAFEAGADEYVSKPFDPNVLLQVLERACHGFPEERVLGRQEKMLSLRVEAYP